MVIFGLCGYNYVSCYGSNGGDSVRYIGWVCFTPVDPRILNLPIVCVVQLSRQFEEGRKIISERYTDSVRLAMKGLRSAMN